MTMSTATTTKATRKVISTKNSELDARLGGGFPAGSLTLIEGMSGAGKSVMSQQIIWGALKDGFEVALFSTESNVVSLVHQMQSIDLDILDYLLLTRLRTFPVELSQLGEEAPTALAEAMKAERARTRRRPDIIVVDSFTSGMTVCKTQGKVLGFFEECKRLCAQGASIFVTLHNQNADDEVISLIRSMCDANFKLRAEQDGQRLVKVLEVAKIRGAASMTGAIVGFDVEPGWGLRVIPISKARG